jgi:hypothetical protein
LPITAGRHRAKPWGLQGLEIRRSAELRSAPACVVFSLHDPRHVLAQWERNDYREKDYGKRQEPHIDTLLAVRYKARSKPLRPCQSGEQINEQEQRNNRGDIDHGCYLTSYIFSQPSRNRKHNSIAIIPRKNIAGSQNATFIGPPTCRYTQPNFLAEPTSLRDSI